MNSLQCAFSRCESLLDCFDVLSQSLKECGVRTFSFTNYAYHPNSASRLKYDVCSPDFKHWHQHYLEEQYNDLDTTLAEVYNSRIPIFWDLKTQLEEAKTEKEKQMRLASIEFGAVCGVSIPLHGPRHDFAILLLVQMKNEHCLGDWDNKQFEFQQIAQLYFHAIQTHLLTNQNVDVDTGLSEREQQCLQSLAQQYSLKQIAKALNITERTVNFHIQNINKKLGTKNKYQSVTRALEEGLLTL